MPNPIQGKLGRVECEKCNLSRVTERDTKPVGVGSNARTRGVSVCVVQCELSLGPIEVRRHHRGRMRAPHSRFFLHGFSLCFDAARRRHWQGRQIQ